MSTKRTYQPSKIKRIKKFGFRRRNRLQSGKKVIRRRQIKGRKRLTS